MNKRNIELEAKYKEEGYTGAFKIVLSVIQDIQRLMSFIELIQKILNHIHSILYVLIVVLIEHYYMKHIKLKMLKNMNVNVVLYFRLLLMIKTKNYLH